MTGQPRHLCIFCDNIDAASKDKWDKACNIAGSIETALIDEGSIAETILPQFDHWKPHCMKLPRQPVTEPVAGTHLDGPPYLRCTEARKTRPVTCEHYEER